METVAVYASRKQLQRAAAVCAAFAVVGVVMVTDDHVLGGLFVLVVFGVVAIVQGLRLRNPKPMFELTAAGLRPSSGGLVPWQDVEDVGVGVLPRVGGVVGIRLSDYIAYVQSAPEKLPKWKRFDTWTATKSMPPIPQSELLTAPQRDLIALLAWNRSKTGGLDISWPQRLLPGPPETLINQIRTYQSNAMSH